jgi:hypothetical protein
VRSTVMKDMYDNEWQMLVSFFGRDRIAILPFLLSSTWASGMHAQAVNPGEVLWLRREVPRRAVK